MMAKRHSRRSFGSIEELPSGRFRVRYRPPEGGSPIAAPATFRTRGDADRFLATVRADMVRGTYLDRRGGQITLAAWTQRWLADNPSKRATTRARDECVMRTHFLGCLGTRTLDAITPLDVRRVVEAMVAKVAPATARTNLAVLAAVLNAAVDADLIARSPVRGIRLPTTTARRRPTLSLAELDLLADAVPGRYRALIVLAGVIGLRWSEAIGLRCCDLDLDHASLRVVTTMAEVNGHLGVAETKTAGSERTLTLPSFVVEELVAHLGTYRGAAGAEDLVFCGPHGGALRRSFAARVFRPAVAEAGLDAGLTFHGLRHVATSLMVEVNAHPRVMQHRLGHSSSKLTMELYAHVSDEADRELASLLDERYREPGD
jgi:integrase